MRDISGLLIKMRFSIWSQAAQDRQIIFGHGNDRFDISNSQSIGVDMNVIIKTNFLELFRICEFILAWRRTS
jgi:hypothetical protein